MALPHAQPLDTIDLRPLADTVHEAITTSLLKTPALQLMRLVLRTGQSVPEHRVPGEITLQCLSGEVVLRTPTRSISLKAGQLLLLPGAEPHALTAVRDAALLVTMVLRPS
jgi:quercetin dioxygenase-like cupin family protein